MIYKGFCSGWECYNEVEITLPEGVAAKAVDGIYCPDCAPLVEFLDDQCPGCVSGFPDCGFADRIRSEAQRDTVRAGKCPIRTNGTIAFSGGVLTHIDLSEPSVVGERVLEMLDRRHS